MNTPRPLALLLAALLAAVLPAAAAPAAAPRPAPAAATHALPFEQEILAFESADRTHPPPRGGVLFLGSSSIRLWKSLATDFPRHAVLNRGFGGSQIADSVRYTPRLVLPHRPRLIVFYAGGNDINAGKTPAQVLADYRAFVQGVHTALPETRIAFVSIAPNPARWSQVDRVRAANALIEAHTRTDPRLRFINVFPHMLGPDGLPKPDIFMPDRLHMNAAGYEIWTRVVAPFLEPGAK